METKYQVLIALVAVLLLVAGFITATKWISKTTGYSVSEEENVAIAQCLSSKGAIAYGLETCTNCQNQKELFDSAFRFVNYVDCASQEDSCSNLESVPAWKINNKIYYGSKELSDLARIAGC